MTRELAAAGEKPLYFVASAQKDLLALPRQVQSLFGSALSSVQFGATPVKAKHWKGEGAGVLELVEDSRGNTFRAIYTVRFARAVYVLHVFQKKSKQGIKTPKPDQDLISKRLHAAGLDYKERYGE